MKKVTRKLKQSLSILLAVAMVITCLPQTATAVSAAENEVVDTEGIDVNDVETTDVVDDAEAADDVEAVDNTDAVDSTEDVDNTEDVEEPGSVEENAEEGGNDAEAEEPVQSSEDAPVVDVADYSEKAEVSNADESAEGSHTYNFKDVNIGVNTSTYDFTFESTENYFSAWGDVKIAVSSSKNQGLQLKSQERGAIVFTTAKKADVTLVVASTGGDNKSHVALKPATASDDGYTFGEAAARETAADGSDVVDNDVSLVHGTGSGTTWTFKNLEPGTYAVVSPKCTDADPADDTKTLHGRDARMYSITVVETDNAGSGEGGGNEGGETTTGTTKTFNFKTDITVTDEIKAQVSNKTYVYPTDTKFDADGYFSTKGKVSLKLNNDSTESIGVEIEKSEGGAIVFTTALRADIKLMVASTSGTNKSSVALKKVENGDYSANPVITTDGMETVVVTGTGTDGAGVPLEYTNVEAGTYAVVSPADSNNRGARVYSITVTEKEAVSGEWFLNSMRPVTYNGEAQTPNVVVMSDGTQVEASRYDVEYKRDGQTTTDLTSVGTIVVTAKGKDADAGKEPSVNYVINPLTLSDENTTVTVGDLAEGTLPVTVETKLKADATAATGLTAGTDYEVEITDPAGSSIPDLSAYNGTAKVKVKGKGNFDGEVTAEKSLGSGVQELSLRLNVDSLSAGTYDEGNCENLAGSIFSLVPAILTETDTGKVSVDTSAKLLSGSVANGITVTNRLKLGGAGSKESRAIKFTAEKTGELSVYVMSSSSSADRKVVLVNEVGGEVVVTDVAQKNGNTTSNPLNEVKVNVYAGRTYYMYSPDGGLNIYYMELVPNENVPPEPSFVNISLELSATEYVYNFKEQVPELTVKFGETVVGPDKYSVKYYRDDVETSNTRSAGTITVQVTGNEGTECAGKIATASYVIKKKTLTPDSTSLYIYTPVYEGAQPSVSVVDKAAKQALESSDYELAYANASDNTEIKAADIAKVKVGTTVRVTATGVGNFEGSVSGEYTVTRKPAGMGTAQYTVYFYINAEKYGTWDWDDECEYDAGSFITIPEGIMEELEGSVVEGWYTDRNFTPKSKWDFAKNVVDKDMDLYARVCTTESGDGLYVQEIPSQTYTGKAIKPAVAVYASDGKTLLKSGKDYTVAYTNNKDANSDPYGELLKDKSLSTITITGKGNYAKDGENSTIVKQFAITQINIDEFENDNVIDVKVADQLVQNSNKDQATLSSVKVNKKALKADVDFEAALSLGGTTFDLKKKGLPLVPKGGVGTYTLEIKGINNYAGTITREIYVKEDAQKLMKNAKIKLGKNLKKIDFDNAVTYNRNWMDLAASADPSDDQFSVSDKNGVIDPSNYYAYVNFANAYGDVAVGKAQLVIEGRGEYSGTKSIAITINGKKFKDVAIGDPVDKIYTGEAIYQNDIVVGPDDAPLDLLSDYKISYKNNVKKGKATMTFTALPTSGYTGSVKKSFKINAATLSYDMITAGLASDSTASAPKMDNMPYSKVAPKPSNKLALRMIDQNIADNTSADGVALKEGTDYTVKYKNNNKVGAATMTLKGKGSLSGEIAISFNIDQASLKDLYDEGVITVAVTPIQAKAGATKDYAVKLKVSDTGKALKAKTDYTLSPDKASAAAVNAYVYPADAAARGEQPTVTITGTGTYADSITVPLSFFDKANKIAKNNTSVVVASAVYDDGKQVTPGVTVKFNGNELTECDETGVGDYTVTYGKNNVAGKNKGTVTITGQGLYGGKLAVKFDILPKPLNGEKDEPGLELDTAFYYSYIDDQILKHIAQAQGKVDGIGEVTYDRETHTFTVPVTDKSVNIDDTFNKLVDKYREDPRIDIGMQQVKDVFMADIQNASEIAVTASYANKAYTEKRDPAKYIDQYKDADKSIIIDDILVQYKKQIDNYNKLHGTDVKTYTLDKVVGKSGSATVKISYKTGKAPVELTYNVTFTDAAK